MRIPLVSRYTITLLALWLSLWAMPPSHAGQVITDDLKLWARQSVQSESALAFDSTANTVAVLYFQNLTGRPELDPLEKGMTLMLITDLAKMAHLEVVERAQLQALTQELALGVSGLVDSDTAPRVGRLLGARHLIGGFFQGLPADAFRIDANVLNVPRDAHIGNADSSGLMDELLRMEKEILFELLRLLDEEPTEAQRQELMKPIAKDLRALMFLFRGIQSSDLGDYEQAAAYYRQALAVEPGLPPAESALSELLTLRLIQPVSNTDAMLQQMHQNVSVNIGPVPGPITRRTHSEPVSPLGPGGRGTADVRVNW